MPRRLIAKRQPSTGPIPSAPTYAAATELLTTLIDFMGYTETVIKPVLLAPNKYFVVSMFVTVGGPIEL